MANPAAPRPSSPNPIALLPTGPLVSEAELVDLLGWQLKPEGLCRDDTCVLVPDPDALRREGKIDARAVAALLDRPSALDLESRIAAIGAERSVRRAAIDDLTAPNFVLPDLDGTPHALSDHRSKKRLLVAFSSW